MFFRKPLATGVFLCYNTNVAKKHALSFVGGALFISQGSRRSMPGLDANPERELPVESAEEFNQTEVRK